MMLFGLLIFACSEKETTTSGLLVSAEFLEFGEQPVYTQETQTFTITSQEPSDVSILSLTLTGVGADDWEVERGDDTELSTGEVLEIDVTFKPQELTTTSPELQIRTTLESQDKIYIALSGTGTESVEDSDEDGYSPADGDCDDNDASRYPNAEELCDGKDNNCDDVIPEDEVDADVDGYRLCADDCDDDDYQVYPGAEEICDQKDSDCDGFIPDNEDSDGDGYTLCDGDCEDEDATIWPDNPEICDGIDNNCSGGVDDIDEDGDGYSPCLINGDCDDNDPTAYPIVLDLSAETDGDGSLDAPYDTLEIALDNLDPVCRTIVMMPGTYAINLAWNDGFVAFNGGGAGPEEVILESDGRIADLSSGGSMRFSNLTIQNGQGSGDGGAIRVQGGDLILEEVYLYNNHAVGDGGAVSVSDGTLTLRNAVFDSNSSEDDGGAISMLSGTLIDNGSQYTSNTGTRGGAILLDVSNTQITGAHFTNNVAGSTGGAIALSAGTLFQVQRSLFTSNTSTEKGGGVFLGNHAQQNSFVRNNIFQGNDTSQKGGALAFSGAISSMMVANNTFVDNQSAQQGAAIFGEATDATGLHVWSNIFYANDGNYALYLTDGSMASVGYNSAFLTTSVVPWYFDASGDAGENREEDPNFVTFSNDGDPSNDDVTLSIGSPMIDAGPPQRHTFLVQHVGRLGRHGKRQRSPGWPRSSTMIVFLSSLLWAADVDISPEDAADIDAAITLLRPGDTLRFTGGIYDVWNWSFTLNGEEDNPIRIVAEEGCEFVIRANEEGAYPSRGFYFSESSFLEIENIQLSGDEGWDGEGVSFEGMRFNVVSDISVRSVKVKKTGGASFVLTGDSTRVTVESSSFSSTRNATPVVAGCSNLSCYVSDFSFTKNLVHTNNNENHDLIYIHDGVQNATISDNVLYGSVRHGITMGHPDNGDLSYVERNAIWNVENAGFVGRGPMVMRNNIIFNTGAQGIYFSNPGTGYEGIVISFNTVVKTGGYGVELRDWYEVVGNVFSNNAVCNPVGSSVLFQIGEDMEVETSGHTIYNNLLCGSVSNLSETLGHFLLGYGYSDFMDVEGWDFYPSEDSMLLNTADPAGENFIPEIDFNGVPRDGAAPEIGAYEWDGANNPGWQIREGFKTYDLESNVSEEVVSEGCCANNDSPEKALVLLPILLLAHRRRRSE